MNRFIAIVLAAVMLLSVTACGGSGNPSSPAAPGSTGGDGGSSAPVETDASYQDTFTIAVNNDQEIMDGQMNVSNDLVLPQVYSYLIKRDLEGNIVGDVAESWEVSEDELTWTFHLKKGVKFHSGKELTAADVKATYDRLLNKDDPVRYTQTMGFIDHCDIVDDYTIQLVTLEPAGPMEASLTLRANTLLNKDYIEKYGKDLGKDVASVDGTGPFKLVEWNKDEDMHLVRHDDYFNGPAATENIVIQIVPEAAARSIAIESHQVDAAQGITAEEVLRLKDDPTINVFSIPGPGCHLFQFNCSNPIIKNTKVRQAISYALDRESLVETLYGAMGEKPRDSVAPAAAFGYINLGVIKQDQAKARQLLAEAGYPDGFEMNLMCTDVYTKGVQAGEIAAAQLAEVGIKANIVTVDRATFSAAWNGLTPEEFPDWGMFLMGAGYITLDGDEGLKRRFATSADGKNSNNYGFYSNAEVDELLNGAAATTDRDAREKAYQRAAEILYLEDPVGCYLNCRNETVVLSAQVEGFDMTPVGIYDWPNIKVRKK